MNFKENILKKIQEIPENSFTETGIIPLLNKMGYEKVSFFGGINENGKDIVFWKKDEWGILKLSVAQVKHFRFKKNSSDKKSFQTIVNQLTNCFQQKLPYDNFTFKSPSSVFLITTHSIDTKTLLTRFGEEVTLRGHEIILIDGEKLVELFDKYYPDFLKNLSGPDYEFDTKINHNFSNELLLKAVNSKVKKDIKAIYSDIDFSLGKLTTSIFFNTSFTPKTSEIEISISDLKDLNEICCKISTEFELNFLEPSIDNINLKNKTILEKQEGIIKSVEENRKKINELNQRISPLIKVRNILIRELENNKKEEDIIRYKKREAKLKSDSLTISDLEKITIDFEKKIQVTIRNIKTFELK